VIQYSLIGDYPVQSFFRLDSNTGIIRTTTSLRQDANYGSFYIARVTAVDNLRPNRVATATVGISVRRNPNSPIFNPTNYARTIPETTPVGSVIIDVNATDADVNVRFCVLYLRSYVKYVKVAKIICTRV